jgi:DNA repair protein RadC
MKENTLNQEHPLTTDKQKPPTNPKAENQKSASYYSMSENGSYEFSRSVSQEEIIELATCIMNGRFERLDVLHNPSETKNYLVIQLSQLEQEVFGCIYLDTRHRVICFEKLFYGTIDGASVHPREVVKNAIRHNAAAVILAHNHPSGVAEPSTADQRLTQRLKDALSLVDVRLIDHIVVGGAGAASFAELGLL